jgi:phage baseplate assembly protein W
MPGYSPKYPLTFNASDGYYRMNKTIRETIKQNVRTLLLTVPGERIMDPDYGVGVSKYLFEFPDTIVGELGTEISYQFNRYLPQVVLSDVDIVTSDDNPEIDPNAVYVVVRYAIPSFGLLDSIVIEESLD